MAHLQTARSFLFAPGSEERKLGRALACGADVVIADLEDAVASAEKDAARELATRLLGEAKTSSVRLVRVNGVGDRVARGRPRCGGERRGRRDRAAQGDRRRGRDGLGRDRPAGRRDRRDGAGLREAFEIASHERVQVLLLGAVDLGLALGLEQREDGQELLFARSSLVVDCAAAGIRPPDRPRLARRPRPRRAHRDCAFARSLGYRGKALIHPDQVAVTHEAFAASTGELERAREIVAAFDQAVAEGRGVLALDGEMIDLPVVERARQLLSDEKRSVLHAD